MILNNLLFLILIFCSIFVITTRHVIFSLFYLVLCFFLASIILVTFENEFVGLILVIIYIGAIAILFLFLIMMINIKYKNIIKNFKIHILTGNFFFIFLLMFLIKTLNFFNNYKNYKFFNYYLNWFILINCNQDIEIYSNVLFSYFVLQILILGIILLVVLLAIVHFTKNDNLKITFLNKQLSFNANLLKF